MDRHGDPLPRTHADKQSAVTLLLASDIGCQMRQRGGDRPLPTPAECRGGRSLVCSGPPRACGPLGLVPPAGCCSTQRVSHTPLRRAEPFADASGDGRQMRFCGRQLLMRGHTDELEFTRRPTRAPKRLHSGRHR